MLISKLRKRTAGFRSRLLTIVSVGILTLALTASLTTAWVTSNQAAEQMVAQGVQIVETLAEQSVLGLIYDSAGNAEKPLDAVMSFPDVVRAGLFHKDHSPLAIRGGQPLPLPEIEPRQAQLVNQTHDAWHFVAPVWTGNRTDEDFQFQLGDPAVELLGYAYVVIDKETLRDMQVSIFLNNIIIALSFALLLVLLTNIGIDRLLRPLYKLIGIMEENEQGGKRVYAELKGPPEITHIASVFNRMMTSLDERDKRLREHRKMLEAEVSIRTRELVEARDAALTASRHKSEFLANMSHELRTPLQAIIGYSDVVREELELEGMEENAAELVRVIHNAQRLLSLINSILDMAKIESGKMDLRLQSVDLDQLLKEAGDTIIPILRKNNNRFILSPVVSETTDTDILLDREKTLQIILNLLSNAGKFTRNGKVSLSATLTPSLLSIVVKDTGIGLTEEHKKVIFDEFRQIDGSESRRSEGTGLGLAISRKFCELMGGKIRVDSEPGKGSTFNVLIPLPVTPPLGTVNTTDLPDNALPQDAI